MSWVNSGSKTPSWISFSDLARKGERSNEKSKGSYSKVEISSGRELAISS